jgi:hypothetical protein
MMKALAYIAMALSILFYGLLVVWLVQLARVGGITQIPQMLASLGAEAAAYGLGLVVLGTLFLCTGAMLAGRDRNGIHEK